MKGIAPPDAPPSWKDAVRAGSDRTKLAEALSRALTGFEIRPGRAALPAGSRETLLRFCDRALRARWSDDPMPLGAARARPLRIDFENGSVWLGVPDGAGESFSSARIVSGDSWAVVHDHAGRQAASARPLPVLPFHPVVLGESSAGEIFLGERDGRGLWRVAAGGTPSPLADESGGPDALFVLLAATRLSLAPAPVSRDAEAEEGLFAAIAADPEGPDDAYLVYADLLQARGDPQGELIAIQISAADDHGVREAELLSAHRSTLFGDAGAWLEALRLTWRRGFVTAVHVDAAKLFSLRGAPRSDRLLAAFLDAPVARLVRDVSVGAADGDDRYAREVIGSLVAADPAPPLVRLSLAGVSRPWYEMELDLLWEAFPQLEEVDVVGSDVSLGTPSGARLRRLSIDAPDEYRGDWIEALRDPALPALRELTLRLPHVPQELARRIAGAPVLERLERLDLSKSYLDDAGAEILASGGGLSKLALDVSDSSLSPEAVKRLSAAAGTIVAERQRPGVTREVDPY